MNWRENALLFRSSMPLGPLERTRPHVEQVEVEESEPRRKEDAAVAELGHLGAVSRGLAVELNEGRADGWPRRRALAHLHDPVGQIGREVALLDVNDEHALVRASRFGDEAHVEAWCG